MNILSMLCGLGWEPAVTLYYSIVVDWLPTLVVVPSVTHRPGHARGWMGRQERGEITDPRLIHGPKDSISGLHPLLRIRSTKKRQVLIKRETWLARPLGARWSPQTGKVALIWLADSGWCDERDNVSNIAGSVTNPGCHESDAAGGFVYIREWQADSWLAI